MAEVITDAPLSVKTKLCKKKDFAVQTWRAKISSRRIIVSVRRYGISAFAQVAQEFLALIVDKHTDWRRLGQLLKKTAVDHKCLTIEIEDLCTKINKGILEGYALILSLFEC
uniref:Uncharacterized protein n=1 Tax=Oryza sativa subsp. japonica TaxID=39947 RepID=Q2R3J3_ORYSJ|nr:hypothetical protein LOC_Os11g31740 [Oryza sativa Japonica Group]